MTLATSISGVTDRALDLSVVGGYSRLGFAIRGLRRAHPPGSLTGQTALVTGAASGIGEAATLMLAAAGARVQMLVRDLERGAHAAARIEEAAGQLQAPLEVIRCDVSSLTDVSRFASELSADQGRLDVLVHNAGVMPSKRERTAEGLELTFATNVLGPFLLTSLFMPLLQAGAPARVITIASGGAYTARLDADDPQLDRRPYDGPRFYAHSKRAEVVLNSEWAKRVASHEVAFHAMHPGWVDTPGLRSSLPRFRALARPILRDSGEGADTAAWLAAADGLEPPSGGFWHDRRPRPLHRVPWTREAPGDAERLWDRCVGLVGDAARTRAPVWTPNT